MAVGRGHNVKYKRTAWKKSKNRKGCIFFWKGKGKMYKEIWKQDRMKRRFERKQESCSVHGHVATLQRMPG